MSIVTFRVIFGANSLFSTKYLHWVIYLIWNDEKVKLKSQRIINYEEQIVDVFLNEKHQHHFYDDMNVNSKISVADRTQENML